MQTDIHVRLQGKQVSHSEDARVDRGRVLDLECSPDRSSLQQQHVDLLDRAQRRIVVVEWQAIARRRVVAAPLRRDGLAVRSRDSDLHTHPRADIGEQSLDANRLPDFSYRDRLIAANGLRVLRHRDRHITVRSPDAMRREFPILVFIHGVELLSTDLRVQRSFQDGAISFPQARKTAANAPCPGDGVFREILLK